MSLLEIRIKCLGLATLYPYECAEIPAFMQKPLIKYACHVPKHLILSQKENWRKNILFNVLFLFLAVLHSETVTQYNIYAHINNQHNFSVWWWVWPIIIFLT